MPLHLLDLPSELITHVLSSLPLNSLLSATSTCKALHSLPKTSASLQYTLLLARSGFSDLPSVPLSSAVPAERLARLNGHIEAWRELREKAWASVSLRPRWSSGIYDLSGGVYFLGERGAGAGRLRTTQALRWMRLPRGSGEGEDKHLQAPSWNRISVDEDIVDIGVSVREHDLVAIVTSKYEQTEGILHATNLTKIYTLHLLQLSTGQPHPSARSSRITICTAPAAYGRCAVMLEVSGDALVVLLTFPVAGPGTRDRIWLFDWKRDIKVAYGAAAWGTYSGFVFVSHDSLMLPNTARGTLDLFRLPSLTAANAPAPPPPRVASPVPPSDSSSSSDEPALTTDDDLLDLNSPLPSLQSVSVSSVGEHDHLLRLVPTASLGLPRPARGCRYMRITCRAEPNPFGPRFWEDTPAPSEPEDESDGMTSVPASVPATSNAPSRALTPDEPPPIPITDPDPPPFTPNPARAIVLLSVTVQDAIPLQFGPTATFEMVVHRSALLAQLEKKEKERAEAEEREKVRREEEEHNEKMQPVADPKGKGKARAVDSTEDQVEVLDKIDVVKIATIRGNSEHEDNSGNELWNPQIQASRLRFINSQVPYTSERNIDEWVAQRQALQADGVSFTVDEDTGDHSDGRTGTEGEPVDPRASAVTAPELARGEDLVPSAENGFDPPLDSWDADDDAADVVAVLSRSQSNTASAGAVAPNAPLENAVGGRATFGSDVVDAAPAQPSPAFSRNLNQDLLNVTLADSQMEIQRAEREMVDQLYAEIAVRSTVGLEPTSGNTNAPAEEPEASSSTSSGPSGGAHGPVHAPPAPPAPANIALSGFFAALLQHPNLPPLAPASFGGLPPTHNPLIFNEPLRPSSPTSTISSASVGHIGDRPNIARWRTWGPAVSAWFPADTGAPLSSRWITTACGERYVPPVDAGREDVTLRPHGWEGWQPPVLDVVDFSDAEVRRVREEVVRRGVLAEEARQVPDQAPTAVDGEVIADAVANSANDGPRTFVFVHKIPGHGTPEEERRTSLVTGPRTLQARGYFDEPVRGALSYVETRMPRMCNAASVLLDGEWLLGLHTDEADDVERMEVANIG